MGTFPSFGFSAFCFLLGCFAVLLGSPAVLLVGLAVQTLGDPHLRSQKEQKMTPVRVAIESI